MGENLDFTLKKFPSKKDVTLGGNFRRVKGCEITRVMRRKGNFSVLPPKITTQKDVRLGGNFIRG